MSREKQWKRIGMLGLLRERSEKMTQSNTSYPRGLEVLLSPRGRWQLKSPRIKRFLEGEKESVLLSDREEQIGGA